MIPWITEIQKYSIHDGPGIRTTVFFKGCPLKCSWCHNPETQSYVRQVSYASEKCSKCGRCVQQCSAKAISIKNNTVDTDMALCNGCKTCLEYCVNGARELIGRRMEPEELIKELKKDSMFYEESGGGITLSGGEVMMVDTDYLKRIMEPLHRQGYRIGIDTCGCVPFEKFEKILKYVDFFLYDIKIMDSKLHQEYTGIGNEQILKNLCLLSEVGAQIFIRIPVIAEVNGNSVNMEQCANYLKLHNIRPKAVHLLPYHSMGKSKYEKLHLPYQGEAFTNPMDEEMKLFAQIFERYGFPTIIGG